MIKRNFIKDLRDSHNSVMVMAEYLRNMNYQVTMLPTKERPSFEQRMDFLDDCDLYLNMPIEVKQTKLVDFPNGSEDWPKSWGGVNVMAVHAWEYKDPKPLFVAVLDKTCSNAAIIHKDTEKYWIKKTQTDRRDGRSQQVFKCPIDKCNWVKLTKKT
jgi:hypothetical protein